MNDSPCNAADWQPSPEPDFHRNIPILQLPAEHVAVLRERAWQPDLFGPLDEASLYHTDTERWGFFSLLLASESGDGRRKSQRTYPLIKLPWVVDRVDPQRDTWITQAEFSKFNRRLVNLLRVGVCFVDLDTYKGTLSAVSQSAQAALLTEFCAGEGSRRRA